VISVLVAVGCMNQAKNKSYLLTMYNYDLAAFSMYNYACQVLTFNPSKVDMTEIGLIHLQTHEDVQWEPIAGDDYLINASDDEDGEQHGSSSTAPTNLFLRTVGKTGSTRTTKSKTVVGQRRTYGQPTSSSSSIQ
jgi:hypothetical protein